MRHDASCVCLRIRIVSWRCERIKHQIINYVLMRFHERLARHIGEVYIGKTAAVVVFSVRYGLTFDNSRGRVVML